MKGRVHEAVGGLYRVVLESGDRVTARLRGRLKRGSKEDRVVIGDEVEVEPTPEGSWVVEGLYPRRSRLVRRGAGARHPRLVAANVDRLVAVVSAAPPPLKRAVVDRLLVVGETNRLSTVLVVNKMDLVAPGAVGGEGGRDAVEALAGLYRGIGYPTLTTSVVTGEGLPQLREVLQEGVSALLGPSGVGKSSLLNALCPGLNLRVGELSSRGGRGRHTTVAARLVELPWGAFVADTPGLSDVGVWGVDVQELDQCFPEFRPLRTRCRFRGCSHLREPGCAVRQAVEMGRVDPLRFESYKDLRLEVESAA